MKTYKEVRKEELEYIYTLRKPTMDEISALIEEKTTNFFYGNEKHTIKYSTGEKEYFVIEFDSYLEAKKYLENLILKNKSKQLIQEVALQSMDLYCDICDEVLPCDCGIGKVLFSN